MKYRILAPDGVHPFARESLEAKGCEIVTQSYPAEEIGSILKAYDAVIIRSATKLKAPQIAAEAGGKLKLIVRAGVGLDNIDRDAAASAGIAVRNTPKAPSNAVAEQALALLLACARGIQRAGIDMHAQKWLKKQYPKGIEIDGRTAGIFGYGRIGSRVGAKLQALGARVLAYDPFPTNGTECATMHYVTPEELLSSSDFVIVTAPASPKPIIDADALARMKDGAILVNVSRGVNVDETALLDALNSGRLRAAGLDVFADEKHPNWALAAHPAVVSTPHIASETEEAQLRIAQEVVEILSEVLGL